SSSSLKFPVAAGDPNYLIGIDSVGGLPGTFVINWTIVPFDQFPRATLKELGRAQGTNRVQVIAQAGQTNLNVTLQASTNLVTWTNLLTTNAAVPNFIYLDKGSVNLPRRYYRVLMLP